MIYDPPSVTLACQIRSCGSAYLRSSLSNIFNHINPVHIEAIRDAYQLLLDALRSDETRASRSSCEWCSGSLQTAVCNNVISDEVTKAKEDREIDRSFCVNDQLGRASRSSAG